MRDWDGPGVAGRAFDSKGSGDGVRVPDEEGDEGGSRAPRAETKLYDGGEGPGCGSSVMLEKGLLGGVASLEMASLKLWA